MKFTTGVICPTVHCVLRQRPLHCQNTYSTQPYIHVCVYHAAGQVWHARDAGHGVCRADHPRVWSACLHLCAAPGQHRVAGHHLLSCCREYDEYIPLVSGAYLSLYQYQYYYYYMQNLYSALIHIKTCSKSLDNKMNIMSTY